MTTATTVPVSKKASGSAAVGSAVATFCAGVKSGSGSAASGSKSAGSGSSAGQPPMTGTVVPATAGGQTSSVTETTGPPVTETTLPAGTPTTASSGPATGGSTTSAGANQ